MTLLHDVQPMPLLSATTNKTEQLAPSTFRVSKERHTFLRSPRIIVSDHIFTIELYSFYTHAFTVSPTEEALAA